MSMREVANHLAAMGRHGDTTLVHMSPQEVSALHGIAAINGTHLTHNPHTGLPEAFSLGGFFKSLLPTIVGAVAAPLTGGTSLMIPVLAGAATGAALNGRDPLMGALMGGLGGFGGAGIGNAISAAGSAGSAAGSAGSGITQASAGLSGTAPAASGFTGAGNIGFKAAELAPSTASLPTVGGVGVGGGALPTLGNVGIGGGAAATQPATSGMSQFVESLGGTGPNADLIAAGKVGLPLGLAGLSAIEPPKPVEDKDKYDPRATLNLGGDSGLRLYAEGGSVYETPDPDSNPAQDDFESHEYGVGGIAGYAYGGNVRFARGGYLDGPGDGMSDSIPATIEGKQPARLADGEFVVPADVVSHLGNGSTKAGAQRLYSMMDKVRKARTGTAKQGRQINPNKYMPA